MGFNFSQWDGEQIFKAGSIKRAGSSSDKVWGEINKTETVLPYGTFVAVNPDGGVKPLAAVTDVIHGIVVLDIYGDGAPADKVVNVGHFSLGDCVVALAVDGQDFKRGDKAYVVAKGVNAGKITKVAAVDNIDLGYWVEEAKGGLAAITLGFNQVASVAVGG